jgi:FkbM family methyltransferase
MSSFTARDWDGARIKGLLKVTAAEETVLMIRGIVKACIKKGLGMAGIEIRRAPLSANAKSSRDSIPQILLQAKAVGFDPQTVVDVGAAYGSFACQCSTVFPNARYLLVEPLEEYRPLLEKLRKTIPALQCVFAAASSSSGEIEINVHPDLVGSSLYCEVEKETDVNGVPRRIRSVTIDHVLREACAKGPFLLKLDVQGAELDVLKGAEGVLRECQYVILEVSFFRFFQDGPDCCEVIAYMKEQGFVPYDIVGLQYRPLDQALSQADIAFVKEAGLFRRHHFYATPQQREAQNRQMKRHLAELFARGR